MECGRNDISTPSYLHILDILQASLHCLCNFEGHMFQMAWLQDAGRLPNLYQT